MNDKAVALVNKLNDTHSLSLSEYEYILENMTEELCVLTRSFADTARQKYYGNRVYLRGLIEIGNYCRNDCYYCGIRRSNKNCDRYMLDKSQIIKCCEIGYGLGFRTFVLQSGEGTFGVEKICEIVTEIKRTYPDCAVTLSLGEYAKEDYLKMFLSGADRYLLRHETADKAHYEKLHPGTMSFENRMRCLKDLRDVGFCVGCGFMVGSPYQTFNTLAKDLKFIEEFSPEMCGIGPFLPQKDTPFGEKNAGSVELTLFLLSLIRLIKPNILLPATTALATAGTDGRLRAIAVGANVVMPNLSPLSVREKYALYDNKANTGQEAAEGVKQLSDSLKSGGFTTVVSRGDPANI